MFVAVFDPEMPERVEELVYITAQDCKMHINIQVSGFVWEQHPNIDIVNTKTRTFDGLSEIEDYLSQEGGSLCMEEMLGLWSDDFETSDFIRF